MSTIDEPRASAENLQQRLDFESLVSDISSKFINLRPGEVDGAIEDALRRVCEPLGIDMAMLWQWSDLTPGVATATHVYTREGVPAPGPLHQAQFPWHSQELLAGRTVALASLDALPAAAAVDRENASRIGIRSNLALPLVVGANQSIGILGLSTVHAGRDWPDALVKRLQLVAQVFTHALARERQEHKLLQSQHRLAASADLAGLAFYEVDFREAVAHVDDRLRDLCGIPADRSQGLQALEFWMRHIHPEDRERVLDLRRQLHAGTLERLSVEYRFPHPTRGERWIHHVGRVARRDASGRTLRSFGVLRDITQSKQAEEALRDLSRRLIRAHEDERALLARELHDDVTQRLAVLAIDVGRAELAAPQGAQADVMRSVRAELVRLSEDIHSLAYQLHPSVLEELGLVEALRAEGERRGRQGRLAVAMDLEPVPLVAGKEAQLCLFRVAQEALTNVARHAGTRAASVTLRQADGGLLLAVSDSGVGFDPANPREGCSLGLASMRERLHLVSGTFDIESAPGFGTTVVAWVPARDRDGPAP
ncbi:MAG: PAS domain-containing protein [Burkholderiaceae bacterium]|jgi:PAS domain S-box-containing protein|nr:PAS domain-containing protein [Burkholderiaceae bacterium]